MPRKRPPVNDEKYNGMSIKIFLDENPPNPRTESDNLGHMVYWHRRYKAGDVDGQKEYGDPEAFLKSLPRGSVVLPMYLLDHSGVALKTTPFNDRWDSGQVGFIYATPEEIRKEYSVRSITKKLQTTIEGVLKAEVEEFGRYMNGEVYGYVLEDDNGKELHACWGYYGEDSCLRDAKAASDSFTEQNTRMGAGI